MNRTIRITLKLIVAVVRLRPVRRLRTGPRCREKQHGRHRRHLAAHGDGRREQEDRRLRHRLPEGGRQGGRLHGEFKNTAWDGIFAGLEAGQYDVMSSVTITDERKKKMDFSVPYINAGQILVVQGRDGRQKLADLKGKNVGAQIGTTGAFEIEKVEGVELKTYDEIGLAFEDLVNGRIDGVVCDNPAAAQYALQKAEYKGKLKIVGEPFTEEYYGVAVKKGNAVLSNCSTRASRRSRQEARQGAASEVAEVVLKAPGPA